MVSIFDKVRIYSYDAVLALYNLITPNLKPDSVVPEGCPGANGNWPEWVAPQPGDSRCSCPALNALANHGVLPRDGKNITFKQLNKIVYESYNFAPTFCEFVPRFAADMLNKKYETDAFDLSELDLHNGIEHDASLTREDVAFQPDQGKPHLPFVEELLSQASGKAPDGSPLLTSVDLVKFSAKRRHDAKSKNPNFSLATIHKMFGSSNSCTMLTIFGGRVNDLRTVLTEEKLPEGWQSRITARKGLTMLAFNTTVIPVEFKTESEQKQLAKSE